MMLDDIEWNPDATGVGSMLMVEPGLPTDEFGHPYQPLFWFAGEGKLLELVVDAEGHLLAWGSREDASVERAYPREIQRVPEAIEAAARRDWDKYQGDEK
jgi:hypothetical protein